MMKQLRMLLLVFLVVASGCAPKTEANIINGFDKVNDIVPFTTSIVDRDTEELIVRNILVNKQTSEITEVTLQERNLLEIYNMRNEMSTTQYYNDRIIVGAMSGGGRSVELIQQEDLTFRVREHPFNIIFYDEKNRKYMTQTRAEDGEQGFYILDEGLTRETFIPLPMNAEDIGGTGAVYPYNLDTILYVGDANGKKFQVQKYNVTTKQWEDVVQLLTEEMYDGYEGYADMSYNEMYPGWASFTINSLTATDRKSARKDIRTLYFVNVTTGEVRTEPIPLFADMPIVTMRGLNVSVMQSKDRIVILDMNPDGVKVLEELYVEDIVPFGEQHINAVVQYTSEDMVINTPDGLIKYTFKSKVSEYIFDYTIKE